MNVIEFVKDNKWLLEDGMIALREIVDESTDYKYFCLNNVLGHSYSNHGGGPALLIDDLKQIVEAFDLVNQWGGIDKSKRILKKAYDSCSKIISDRRKNIETTWSDLNNSIQLVEKCQ